MSGFFKWGIQEGSSESVSDFKNLKKYLKQDMSNPELYENLLSQMDMQSFIDWMCTNIYIANTDTKPLGSNVFTRNTAVPGEGKYQDGKWRWMLYDLDDALGAGIDIGIPSYAIDSFTEHAGYAPSGFSSQIVIMLLFPALPGIFPSKVIWFL